MSLSESLLLEGWPKREVEVEPPEDGDGELDAPEDPAGKMMLPGWDVASSDPPLKKRLIGGKHWTARGAGLIHRSGAPPKSSPLERKNIHRIHFKPEPMGRSTSHPAEPPRSLVAINF